MNAIHCIALKVYCLCDSKCPHVSRLLQYTVKFLPLAKNFESNPLQVYSFHRRANLTIELRRELGQVPFRDFSNDVIEGGFETRGRGLRDGIRKFWQSIAKREL